MDLIKSSETFLEETIKDKKKIYLEEDIIVPDIKPDVLKIIQVDAKAVIAKKEISNEQIKIYGNLLISIIYLPETGEENISYINTTIPFDTQLKNSQIFLDSKYFVTSEVGSLDFYVLNSRKLSIKSNIDIFYKVFKTKSLEIPIDIDYDAQIKYKEINNDKIVAIEECEFSVKNSYELMSGKKSIKEIIKSDVRIDETEYKILQGKIILKGNLCNSILYYDDDNCINCTEFNSEFTQIFDVDEICETDRCRLNLNLQNTSFNVREDNDGDLRIIEYDFVLNVSLVLNRTTQIKMIEDCYFPGNNTTYKKDEIKINTYIDEIASKKIIKEIFKPDESLPKIDCIYNIYSEKKVSKVIPYKNKVCLSGEILIYILYITNNENQMLCNLERKIPFEYEYECIDCNEKSVCTENVNIQNLEYNVNMSGEIEIKFVLEQKITVSQTKEFAIISQVEIEEKSACGDIIVYFTKNDDTLWEIGKKYAIKCDKIKELNNIEENDDICNKKLIIPNYKY